MHFGLKNVGAMYQRVITMIFYPHLEEIIEVYIDDMLVKSLKAEQHLKHLEKTVELLEKYTMKFNPAKCCSGISSKKFLSF